MITQNRMSPLTALFIGVFGVVGVGIASGTSVVLYGMHVLNRNAAEAIDLVDNTIGGTLAGLPDLLASLPDAVNELLNDRRAPDYASNIGVTVDFVVDDRTGGVRPVLTVVNNGDSVVSLLAVRVAALNENQLPVEDWTEVIATPVAVDHDWRGPLMPGNTRHVALSRRRGITAEQMEDITGVWEISDIRVWQPLEAS